MPTCGRLTERTPGEVSDQNCFRPGKAGEAERARWAATSCIRCLFFRYVGTLMVRAECGIRTSTPVVVLLDGDRPPRAQAVSAQPVTTQWCRCVYIVSTPAGNIVGSSSVHCSPKGATSYIYMTKSGLACFHCVHCARLFRFIELC